MERNLENTNLALSPKNNNNQLETLASDSIQIKKGINDDNFEKSKHYVIKNNYWNEGHTKILKGLQQNSNKLYREYQKAHLKYKNKLKIYRIPIIIMSSLSGFLSISNSGYIPIEYQPWVSLLVGFVNLMVTLISLIENFKKIDVNVNKTYSSYMEFKKLHDEISIMLTTPQNEREGNGYDISMQFFNRYESYVSDAPILQKAIKDFLDENSEDNSSQTFVDSDDNTKKYKNKMNEKKNQDIQSNLEYVNKRKISYPYEFDNNEQIYFNSDETNSDMEMGQVSSTFNELKKLLIGSKNIGVIKKNNLNEQTNKKIKNVTKLNELGQDRIDKVNRFQEQFDQMERLVDDSIDKKVNKINLENNLNISSDNFPVLKNVKVSKNIIPNTNLTFTDVKPNLVNIISDDDEIEDDGLVNEEFIHKPFKPNSQKLKDDSSTSSTNN